MKIKQICAVASLCLLGVAKPSLGFDIPNHEDLSAAAFRASVLNKNSTLLLRLGATKQEYSSSQGGEPKTVADLIAFGAAWEDKVNEFTQASRHFYNPLNGRGLYYVTTTGIIREPGTSSRRWAVESNGDRFQNVSVPPTQRFSYRLGRQYFFDALTKQSKDDRDAAWGLTFQTIGHVIHHIQDMAQPQHTRNDFHCDRSSCEFFGILGGVKLAYEKWNSLDTNRVAIKAQFDGYDPVFDAANGGPFRRPEDFWSTGEGSEGIGIAQYTNRGFFTSGTNVGNLNFPRPVTAESTYRSEAIASLCAEQEVRDYKACAPNMKGNIKFYSTQVNDSLRPSQSGINPRATSRSIFDEDLQLRGLGTIAGRLGLEAFSVNRFTYDATNSFVLKRAVGYSAGMINFFFRGNIDLVADQTEPNTYLIKNLGNETLSGTFDLFYDDDDGFRKQLKTWELTLQPGSQVNIGAIAPPASPMPKTPNEYILVFHGDMGDETRAAYGVGGVTAAVVRLGAGNVLYTAGVDATNQLVLMRTDASGTQVLTGNEFHPLRNLFAFNRTALPKAYVAKQSEFAADGSSYRVRAVTVGAPKQTLDSIAYVFHREAAEPRFFIDYREFSNVMAWQSEAATSAGMRQFHFRLLPKSESSASLAFTRFDLGNGNPQIDDTGTITLPAPPRSNISYIDANRGKILASPDGLRLIGFRAAKSLRELAHYELRLTVGDTVSAQWVETRVELSTSVSTKSPSTATLESTRMVTSPLTCGSEPPKMLEVRTMKITESESIDNLYPESAYFDFQKGELLSLNFEKSQKYRASFEEHTEFAGEALYCDPVRQFVIHNHSGSGLANWETTNSYSIGGGKVSTFKRELAGDCGISDRIAGNCSLDYHFEGITTGSIPAHQFDPAGPPAMFESGTGVLRPLTAKISDAIVYDMEAGAQSRIRFAGQPLVGTYVADSSSLGEVFVATADLSVMIHRPRAGGMQVWQRPPSVVRLLGAIWL